MSLWMFLVIVCILGLLGEVLNAFLSDNGFFYRKQKQRLVKPFGDPV